MFLNVNSKGIITVNTEDIHCFQCTGKVIIEDCIFENMLDDGVNIHVNYTVVKSIDVHTITMSFAQQNMFGLNLYGLGDIINVYRGKAQDIAGQFTVEQSDLAGYNQIVLKVKEDTAMISTGDVIDNTIRMPEIEIRRCKTGKNRPRGFLISTGKKTLIEDCVFTNSVEAINFTGDTTYWYESGPVGDVTIRRCHFKNCGYSAGNWRISVNPSFEPTIISPFYHKILQLRTIFLKRSAEAHYMRNMKTTLSTEITPV